MRGLAGLALCACGERKVVEILTRALNSFEKESRSLVKVIYLRKWGIAEIQMSNGTSMSWVV